MIIRTQALGLILVVITLISVIWWRAQTSPRPIAYLVERYALPKSTFLKLAGTRIHVVDEGSGPPIVMLHGNANSLWLWNTWADILVAKGYRVLRIDLPPYGLSGPSDTGEYGVVKSHEILQQLFEIKSIKNAVLIGAANGAPPAAWLATTNPELVKSLVFINSPFVAPELGLASRFDTERWLGSNVYNRIGRPKFATAHQVRALIGSGSKLPNESMFIEHIHDISRRSDVPDALAAYGSSFNFISQSANPGNMTNEVMLGKLKKPVLILWGSEGLLGEEEGEKLADMVSGKRAQLITYQGLGHWFPASIDNRPLIDLVNFIEIEP